MKLAALSYFFLFVVFSHLSYINGFGDSRESILEYYEVTQREHTDFETYSFFLTKPYFKTISDLKTWVKI